MWRDALCMACIYVGGVCGSKYFRVIIIIMIFITHVYNSSVSEAFLTYTV